MKHLSRSVAALSLLALLGAGCGSTPAATPDSNATSTASQTPPKVASAIGDCLNLFYPLKQGSEIDYDTKTGSSVTSMKITVVQHDQDSIKLGHTFTVKGHDTTLTNELVCDNGVIRGKGYFDSGSALSGLNISYETVSMSGDILPKDLPVGKTWTSDNEVIIHTDEARFKALMDGKHQKTHAESKVLAEEDVTVPAGTFHAIKVEQVLDIDSAMANTHIKTTTDTWYVKDVGIVKIESKNGTASSVTEATKVVQGS